MNKVDVQEVEGHLQELLARVAAGEEVVIAQDDRPLAKLVRAEPPKRERVLGQDRGKIWIADDFDETLPEFEDYM